MLNAVCVNIDVASSKEERHAIFKVSEGRNFEEGIAT